MDAEQLTLMISKPYRTIARFGYDFCNGLLFTWLSSGPGIQLKYDLDTDQGADDWTYWWISGGRANYPGISNEIDRTILQTMHLDHLSFATQTETPPITPLLSLVHRHRKNVGQADDIASPAHTTRLWRWWRDGGRLEYFGQSDWLIEAEAQSLRPPEMKPSLEQKTLARVVAPEAPSAPADEPRVSLVGYPKGEFGLGEDVRLLRAALDQAGVKNIVIKAPWPIMARQSIDEPSVDAVAANFDCDVMFYVMPPVDTATLFAKVGASAFAARRKIGFWQWELDHFPIPARRTMDLVDEIWCHSEHAATAFRAATEKPVIKVPLPVFVPEPKRVPRASFGLPADAFMVFTGYDGASAVARKNPLAAILAFQQAFPKDGEIQAGLVVKAMNTMNDSLWRECRRKASIDQRIIIIDDVLDRNVYYELLRNCDAVLSLHRAEGFGRLMAEAMALGMPVIASRYSGNLDFMTDENSWLVNGELVPLFVGDYALHQGQKWLEPNVAEAARALRECATNAPERQRRAALGKQTVTGKYDLTTCGSVYSELLGRNPALSQAKLA